MVPSNALDCLAAHLETFVGSAPGSCLFTTPTGERIVPGRLDRVWGQARQAVKREDVCLHDLRHTGLTWVGAPRGVAGRDYALTCILPGRCPIRSTLVRSCPHRLAA